MKDEYFCFGCRRWHKLEARPPVAGQKRAYCAQALERAAKRVAEMRKKSEQR